MSRDPHGHTHMHVSSGAISISRAAKVVIGLLLALAALGTAIGLVTLWPDPAKVSEAAQQTQHTVSGVSYERGEVVGLFDECEGQAGMGDGTCVSVELTTGEDAGDLVSVAARGALAQSGLRIGDEVQVTRYPVLGGEFGQAGTGEEAGAVGEFSSDDGTAGESQAEKDWYEVSWGYELSGIVRNLPLLVLVVLFVVVVVWVGRLRGALSLLALGVSVGVVIGFIIPALITGAPGLLVAVVGSSAILFATLYFVHGPNLRTTAALFGTLCGILIMTLVSTVFVHLTRLSGLGNEESTWLSAMSSQLDFRGLLTAAIIIAGLGILNDVTITQSSAVWELRASAPEMSRREVYARAMRIGRDHIASTVYTVFFAYVGAALSVLILLYFYNRPFLSLLTNEEIVVEIVSTLCGSIGLVLSVPITTAVATLLAKPAAATAQP